MNHINLIEGYKEIYKRNINQIVKVKISKYNRLFTQYPQIKKIYLKELKTKAPKFNIFEILKIKNIKTLEVKTHSPILGNLLDIEGSHAQNKLFYKLFLEELKTLKIDTSNFEIKDNCIFKIELEKKTYCGDIDIFISGDQNNKFAICIENKINAKDQEKQLERYYNYLSKSKYRNNFLLIYLTKFGQRPSEESISKEKCDCLIKNKKLVLLSYDKNISNILNNSLKFIEPPNVKVTVIQYSQIIKSF